MNTYLQKVNEFREAMGLLDRGPEFWYKLIKEEREEFLKECCDLVYVECGYDLVISELTGSSTYYSFQPTLDRFYDIFGV